jgi:CRP-like cAMP-binding protein
MQLDTIIKQVELFRGLDEEQLKQITAIAQMETYSAHQTVFSQGSTGDAVYIVGKGQVEVQVRANNGESYAAIYLGEGQVFGEMALIDQGKRSASILTVDDNTTIYRIPTDRFLELCRTNTDIGYLMMRNIAQDLSFKLRHRDFDPSDS